MENVADSLRDNLSWTKSGNVGTRAKVRVNKITWNHPLGSTNVCTKLSGNLANAF